MKILLLLLLLTTPLFAQWDNAEFGTLSEIKGQKKVFVAVSDLSAREVIVKALEKAKFEVVSRESDSEFSLWLGVERVDTGSNALLRTAHNIVLIGEMRVYIPTKRRILWHTRKVQDWSGGLTFDKHPAKSTVNEFIKAYKKLK